MHQVSRVKVDKNMAKLFLSLEEQPQEGVEGTNRKWSPIVVNNYAFDMLSGGWRENHQGLAFKGFLKDDTAVYADGGQRARAIVQAATVGAYIGGIKLEPDPEISFYFMVTEGLTQEEVDTLDRGKHRTPGDIVQMAGYVNKNVTASMARLCYLYENVPWSPENWRKHPVTPAMIKVYLQEHPRIKDAVLEGSRLHKQMIISSAAAGYHEALVSGVEQKKIDEFMDHLHSGADLPVDSPILALRELLAKTTKKKRKWTREEQFALFIKAFLKWEAGEVSKAISFRTTGEYPDRFPRYTN